MEEQKKVILDLNKYTLQEYETIHTRVGELKNVLYHLMGYERFTGFVRGKPSQVDSLVAAAAAEKSFLNNMSSYGSSDPRTISSKYDLEQAIRKFESETNIAWPIR